MSMKPVVIVGAGLSGLCCARTLAARGVAVEILERSDGVGGRVRTDEVDGFLLDRGFQILLTGYPELSRHLDLEALDLRQFDPGARLWTGRGFERIGDPLRDPGSLVPSLLARSGTLLDKWKVLGLRRDAVRGSDYGAFERADGTTLELLRERGFSEQFIERFFRPFLGGIFLEPRLETTSRFFQFVFRMLATGGNAVPARGMEEIPRQLVAGLPQGTVSVEREVVEVGADFVRLADGSRRDASAVVVACEAPAARALLPELEVPAGRAVTCFYFDAPSSPASTPILHLDATGEGPVNNAHVVSSLSERVAPAGRSLVSATVLGGDPDLPSLEAAVREQLGRWFGQPVTSWRSLRQYVIKHAIPAQPVGSLEPPRRPARTREGVFVCGDHRDQASIDGAMASGRRVAEGVAEHVARSREGGPHASSSADIGGLPSA